VFIKNDPGVDSSDMWDDIEVAFHLDGERACFNTIYKTYLIGLDKENPEQFKKCSTIPYLDGKTTTAMTRGEKDFFFCEQAARDQELRFSSVGLEKEGCFSNTVIKTRCERN